MVSQVVRSSGALLLLNAACAAAVAPVPTVVNATDRLEALVHDMDDHQNALKRKGNDDDVVVLDGGDRRRLGRCDCTGGYRNGASVNGPVCSKQEGSVRVCYPTKTNGRCSDHHATRCGSGGGNPLPSPGPVLFDAEEAVEESFLNFNLQLTTASQASLPPSDAFAAAIAHLAQTDAGRVSVITSSSTGTGVRSSGAVVAQPTEAGASATKTATVHATIATSSTERREQLENLMRTHAELPVDGIRYRIANVQVLEQATSEALVCSERHKKSEASNLLGQLVELKRQEVDLMRQAVVHASQQPAVDTALLQRIAAALGVAV